MHALFELDKLFGIDIVKMENDPHNIQYGIVFQNSTLNKYLERWVNAKEQSVYTAETKEEYEKWKITFPTSLAEEDKKRLDERRKNGDY